MTEPTTGVGRWFARWLAADGGVDRLPEGWDDPSALIRGIEDAARAVDPEQGPHPEEPHEFRMTCHRCGESGRLFVAFITDLEVVKIEPRPPVAAPVDPPETGPSAASCS